MFFDMFSQVIGYKKAQVLLGTLAEMKTWGYFERDFILYSS